MAKKIRSKSVLSSGMDKLSIPGINISELLDFEELFPDIRYYIATLMLPIVAIAQIRIALMSSKPTIIQNLSSVNLLNRCVLAKSDPLLYVTSAVALRRTAVAYANDESQENIILDHNDLRENTTGPVVTRGGLAASLGNPDRLRAYRRGLMAQTTGEMQATPIHSSRRLARDIENVSPEDYLSRLPFDTSDLDIGNIYSEVNHLISPTGNIISCVEYPTIASGTVLMENGLLYTRNAPAIPDVSKAPTDLTKLPVWRRVAIKQAKNLGGEE
jgi:hypothetical protein